MNSRLTLLAAVTVSVFFLLASAISGWAAEKRQAITYEELMNASSSPAEPVANENFLPSADAGPALHTFNGGLVLTATEMSVKPEFKSRKVLGGDPKIFPGVVLRFFSSKGDLIPIDRGAIITPPPEMAANSFWEIIVSPGRVWSEPGDRGWSRAAFPFALLNMLENETHNGIATFLFNDKKVSAVRFQVVQQTTPYYIDQHFVAWGQIPAKYERTPLTGDKLLAEVYAYGMEKTTRFPTAPWSALAEKVGAEKLAGYEGKMNPQYLVWSALVYEGVLYAKPCRTPFGDYPYLDYMRVGVWSVTKSVAAGLAMLRLAEKYGPYVFNLKIKDYVHITATHDGWENVTFADALNMATGIGGGTVKANPNNMFVDYEFSGLYDEFYRAKSAEEKIELVCKVGRYPWGPGEVARYRDRDMFMLGAAMDGFLKRVEGKEADIWDMVAEEVLKPIHVYHAPITRTIEPDGRRGLPITAWGWLPSMDDLAKVADLLHHRGYYNGRQILHRGKTTELFSIEGSLSKGTKNTYGVERYKMSFHYVPFRNAAGKLLYFPYMSGWIGNRVVLLPGNMTAIRISKAWPAPQAEQEAAGDPTPMVEVANRIRPF